jgi:hypothetical protein
MVSASVLAPDASSHASGAFPLVGASAPLAAPDPDREYTTREAAAFVGCSEGFLIKLRAGDGPPYHRRFKRKGIYYLESDLVSWRKGRRYLSTAEY